MDTYFKVVIYCSSVLVQCGVRKPEVCKSNVQPSPLHHLLFGPTLPGHGDAGRQEMI